MVNANPVTDILEALGVSEGPAVTTQLVDSLAKAGKSIQDHAISFGLKVDPRWMSDISRSEDMAANIEIQVGRRRAFPNSEVITVKIFDATNFKVIITDNLRRALDLGDTALFTFETAEETLNFLTRAYGGVGIVAL